jgi:hypothetical protein
LALAEERLGDAGARARADAALAAATKALGAQHPEVRKVAELLAR